MRAKRFLHKIACRLNSQTGETIAESLVGILIVSLAFVMICGAVVTAARINTSIRVEDTAFVESDSDTSTGANVSIVYSDNTNVPVTVKGYVSTQGGYVYYETN